MFWEHNFFWIIQMERPGNRGFMHMQYARNLTFVHLEQRIHLNFVYMPASKVFHLSTDIWRLRLKVRNFLDFGDD